MNKEELKQEHAQLKERLAKLVDFISSEEYYMQDDIEKHLLATQRSGMEMYINALSLRLWGKEIGSTSPSSFLPLLMSTMLLPTMSAPLSSLDLPKGKPEAEDEQ